VSPVKYGLGFYIPQDDVLHSHCREKLKSYMGSPLFLLTPSCNWKELLLLVVVVVVVVVLATSRPNRFSRQCGILNISQTYRPSRPVRAIDIIIITHFGSPKKLRPGANAVSYVSKCELLSFWEVDSNPGLRTRVLRPLSINTKFTVCEDPPPRTPRDTGRAVSYVSCHRHRALCNGLLVTSPQGLLAYVPSLLPLSPRPYILGIFTQWASGQSSWVQTQRSRVRFPALPDFLCSSGSGTGSTQPL
jgi:hypothetical protein